MVTALRVEDAAAKRVADAAAEAAAREAAATKKSDSRNAASEIVLWKSVSDMDDALAAVGSAGANKKKALLEQIDARVLRPLFVYQFPVVKGLPAGPAQGRCRGSCSPPGPGGEDDPRRPGLGAGPDCAHARRGRGAVPETRAPGPGPGATNRAV